MELSSGNVSTSYQTWSTPRTIEAVSAPPCSASTSSTCRLAHDWLLAHAQSAPARAPGRTASQCGAPDRLVLLLFELEQHSLWRLERTDTHCFLFTDSSAPSSSMPRTREAPQRRRSSVDRVWTSRTPPRRSLSTQRQRAASSSIHRLTDNNYNSRNSHDRFLNFITSNNRNNIDNSKLVIHRHRVTTTAQNNNNDLACPSSHSERKFTAERSSRVANQPVSPITERRSSASSADGARVS